ncbi:putative carboxylesterase 16 [Wolffia australiana]
MPTVAVKLYSVFFKLLLKHRLQTWTQILNEEPSSFGVSCRSDESVAAPNPTFSSSDGIATKDIHIDPLTSLSIRIFLPDTVIAPNPQRRAARNPLPRAPIGLKPISDPEENGLPKIKNSPRRFSYGGNGAATENPPRRRSYDGAGTQLDEAGVYRGYLPSANGRKLPLMLQFHGGAFVCGSSDSVANDLFCRRIAKLCDVIVIAVGYRLAPESKYPAAFDDGFKVLAWLAKQANLAECRKSMGHGRGGGVEMRKLEASTRIVDAFGTSQLEPWLASHGDPSRCVLLGVSCGANIADFVARKAVEAGQLLAPLKVVAQVLMYPFFIGSVPTHSEIKLANSYFFDKSMCMLAWKLFLPKEEFSLDHPAANPLIPGRGPPLKRMPPTLTVVAEHDWMRDRAIAYSEELRKVNVDAPVLDYKDAVHEFATLDMLLKSPQAQACAEDIAIWVKKYISIRGHEFSY